MLTVCVPFGMKKRFLTMRTPSLSVSSLLMVPAPSVSFEVDEWDPGGATGWSVVVQGLAYEASDREMECEDIRLDSPGERQNSRWVRLMPDTITGRRIARRDGAPTPPLLERDWRLGSSTRARRRGCRKG